MNLSHDIILKIAKNKVLHYILSRYLTYILQFINSLFIAIYLGPFYLGVWGFVSLIIQYFAQINFGISHSVNVIASIHKNKKVYVTKIVGTAMTLLLFLSVAAILFFCFNEFLNLNIGSKYNFSYYGPFVCAIAVLSYFNSLLFNIFRVYGRLLEIAFSQSITPILMLITLLFFRGERLLWALVITNFISVFLAFIIFLIKSPIKIHPIFNWYLTKIIYRKGLFLFLYNTSFYLIIISTRTLVSVYYPVTEFGYFTFAFSLVNAISLLFDSFSFLIFPKLLNRFASSTKEHILKILDSVRDAYISLSHGLIHLAILLFPCFLSFFPQYELASGAFNMIALTVVLQTNSFGYQGLLIARGKEKLLGLLAFMALFINVLMAFILICLLHVPYSLVILSTLFSYLLYVFLLGFYGRKKLGLTINFFSVLKDVYPNRLLIPYLISVFLVMFSCTHIYFILPVLFFILLNHKSLGNIINLAKKIIKNPNLINV